jgi:hypothetical protein
MSITRVRRLLLCCVSASAVLSGSFARVTAQDLGGLLGPLASQVGLGQSGSWTASAENGWFVLSDPNDAGAVRFYTLPWQGDVQGRSVGVRVQASSSATGSAGLLYRVQDRDPRWLAFVVARQRTIALYARTASGLSTMKEVDIPGGVHPEGEWLQISERSGVATLWANGSLVAQLDVPSGRNPEEPVGVLAIGPGRFAFRAFAFGPAIPTAQGGDDRIPTGSPPGDDERGPTLGPTLPSQLGNIRNRRSR